MEKRKLHKSKELIEYGIDELFEMLNIKNDKDIQEKRNRRRKESKKYVCIFPTKKKIKEYGKIVQR